MRILPSLILAACFLHACGPGQSSPETIINRVTTQFYDRHHRFSDTMDAWGDYTLNLTIEALLNYELRTGDPAHSPVTERFFSLRAYDPGDTILYTSIPFSNPYYSYYQIHRDPDFAVPYVSESRRMDRELGRTAEGAICIEHEGHHRMLIDYLQYYAIRMARTGMLTGDEAFYEKCVSQYELYRNLLRDQESGLWSQGRGWLPDSTRVSPGAWSRGHGWLLRGLVTSLEHLPAESIYYERLLTILESLSETLHACRDEDGMWHTLLHLPPAESEPETSGSGMIAYYWSLAVANGYLPERPYKAAALHTLSALRKYITPEGVVRNACAGPGPLRSIENYHHVPIRPGDPHGPQAIIYAMTGEMMLRDSTLTGQ